ncbi:MAG: hypothetical protein LBK63_04925 [Treponema sp.]|jgi:hypothetical protein|nr:hypothetical protein [Treponema sp.]
MMVARPLLALPLILCAAMAVALGSGEGGEKPETVRVTGVVRLAGSGPVAELFIAHDDREWQIDRKDRDRLWNLQQQTVTVEGEEWTEELIFADGRPAGERRHLRNITIIEPKQ